MLNIVPNRKAIIFPGDVVIWTPNYHSPFSWPPDGQRLTKIRQRDIPEKEKIILILSADHIGATVLVDKEIWWVSTKRMVPLCRTK